uniref:UBA domain-containing protein n=1 Tax=Pristionchus pacificus TaxID=54126 RepID=A0A8R1Z822_PRIPA
MSYDHTFADYIKQLTLVRSSRYFPSAPSQVVLRPPPTPYECDYSFEVEYAARRAHEAYTRAKNDAAAAAAAAAAAPSAAPAPPPHRASPVDGRVSLPSTSHAVLQPVRFTPVLQPSRPSDTGSSLPSVSSTSSLASSAAGAAATVQQENFEDFEGGATIFDELHMKSIDDRSALNEIWGAVQVLPNSTVSFNAAAAAAAVTPAAPVPKPRSTVAAAVPPQPTTVVPTRAAPVPPTPAAAAPPARPLAPKPGMNGIAIPNGVATPAKPTATSPPTLNDSRAALGAKLTAKGFRSHVVQLALATLAHEQLPYVEYYIKATSNLEKVKVPADRGLAFLMDCKLTEKQDIIRHADVVTQLSGMGFPMEKCMAAAKEAKGDRVKALDVCLAS